MNTFFAFKFTLSAFGIGISFFLSVVGLTLALMAIIRTLHAKRFVRAFWFASNQCHFLLCSMLWESNYIDEVALEITDFWVFMFWGVASLPIDILGSYLEVESMLLSLIALE